MYAACFNNHIISNSCYLGDSGKLAGAKVSRSKRYDGPKRYCSGGDSCTEETHYDCVNGRCPY